MTGSSVKLSRRTAQDLLDGLRYGGPSLPGQCRADLERALKAKPKRFVLAHAKRTRAKKASRKEVVSRTRGEVFDRAGCNCDYCMVREDQGGVVREPTEWEHPFGRVRVRESTDTTLAVCHQCHVERTAPKSAIEWWTIIARAFLQHGCTWAANEARNILAKHEAKKQLGGMRHG